jgi:hypothetical protein
MFMWMLHEVEYKVSLLLSLASSQNVYVNVTWGWIQHLVIAFSLQNFQIVYMSFTWGWIQS